MNCVWLIERAIYESKMSQARFSTMKAVGRRCKEYVVTGNGWPGYEVGASVAENFDRLGLRPDFVVLYKPEHHFGVADYDGSVKVIRYNEAWWPEQRAHNEVMAAKADLVVLHHENDIARFPSDAPYRTAHIPHCADRSVFFPSNGRAWSDRSVPALVAGVLSDSIYPLRGRWAKLIQSGRIEGQVRRHPGYRLGGLSDIERQFSDYARSLQSAKLFLTCGSIYQYALAKYVEAMMAGCVVVADMPNDAYFRRTLGQFVVEVDPNASDDQLVETVQSTLASDDLVRRSREGSEYAAKWFGTDRYATDLLLWSDPLIYGRERQVQESAD